MVNNARLAGRPSARTSPPKRQNRQQQQQQQKKKRAVLRQNGAASSASEGKAVKEEAAKKNVTREMLTDTQRGAFDAVVSGKNAFITGPGGVGKSMLIELLQNALFDNEKVVASTAPTGVAADNICGVTIHSFMGCGVPKRKVTAAPLPEPPPYTPSHTLICPARAPSQTRSLTHSHHPLAAHPQTELCDFGKCWGKEPKERITNTEVRRRFIIYSV